MNRWSKHGLAACIAVAGVFVLTSASAQLPLGQPQPKPAPTKSSDSEEQEYRRIRDKKYEKPERPPMAEGEPEALSGYVLSIKFDGMVNPGMGEYVISGIHRAQADGAQAVLIELDTPGGLVSTTRKIAQAMLASEVPVIVYVYPAPGHAASAGTFITLASHIAAMAPATTIGAAHPVTGGGDDPEASGKHMGRKVENDLVAMVEGIAKERSRNSEWAVDAVRYSVAIGAKEALDYGVIEYVADSSKDLFEQLDAQPIMVGKRKVQFALKNAEVVEHELKIRESLLNLLASPGIAMILGLLGIVGILAEMYHPGMIIPGVLGVLCILLSLISMEQLPIDLGGVILIIAGIGLMVAEIYTPTFGVLGVLGGVGLVTGAMLLVDLDNPDFSIDPSFALSFMDTLPLVLTFAGFVLFIGFSVTRSRSAPVTTGKEGLVGATGVVLKPVGPEGGMIFVGGEYWKAESEQLIAEHQEVEVISVEGLNVRVRPKSPKAGTRESPAK